MLLSRQLRIGIGLIPRNRPKTPFLLDRRFALSALDEETEEQIAQARKWLASFTPESLPRKTCEITFSRASGPGRDPFPLFLDCGGVDMNS